MSNLPVLAEAMANGDTNAMKSLHEQAKRELAVFEKLPCNGRLAPPPKDERDPRYVADCTTDYAFRCIMRDHRGCPRLIRDALKGAGIVSPIERRSELRRLGIPDEPAAYFATEATLDTKGSRAVLEFLADRSQRLLVLSGDARTGKTYAAALAVARSSASAMFLLAGKIGERARDKQQWDRMRAVRLLVIDDASTEFHDEKGWMASVWDNLIVDRYDAGLQTLLTTNKALETFVQLYGKRIAARVLERGSFVGLGTDVVQLTMPPKLLQQREPGEDDE